MQIPCCVDHRDFHMEPIIFNFKDKLMNKFFHKLILFIACIIMLSCNNQNRNYDAGSQALFTGEPGEVKLVVLDPGHFHASLLQKFPQSRVNDTVYVYAREGEELEQ